MMDKVATVHQELGKLYESLMDIHGEGILDGFTYEFLDDE